MAWMIQECLTHRYRFAAVVVNYPIVSPILLKIVVVGVLQNAGPSFIDYKCIEQRMLCLNDLDPIASCGAVVV